MSPHITIPKIVVTHWIHDDVAAQLSRIGQVVLNPTRETWPRTELLERCRDADALIAFMPDSIDDAFLAACPRLRMVSAALKGFDNFDIAACTRRGIWFTIVPDLLTEPTAELALGLLFVLTRNIIKGDRVIRSGQFSGWKPQLYGTGLAGGTAGILGLGQVGRALASRLAVFGARLIYHDTRRLPESEEKALGIHFVERDRLFAEADFVFPFLPLTPETHHLINAASLARMKPGSYLINCGRGSLVDEATVAEALRRGQLAGYAADVFEMEDWARSDRPREVNPTLLDPGFNTVFTPHLGSAVDRVRREIAREAVLRIEEWSRGERPRHAVNELASTLHC